jgi:hypothetical protein
MWPLVAVMLIMGVASTYWFKTLDANATALATAPTLQAPPQPNHVEAESYPKPTFVDPELKAAALQEQQAAAPEGRRY